LAGDSVSEAIIYEKARLLYSDITRDTPGSSAEEFKASCTSLRTGRRFEC